MRSHSVGRWLFVAMFLAVFQVLPLHAEDRLPLSPREQVWLQEHPVIVVGMYDKGWPPYEAIENGQPQGLGYDYLRELAERLGVELQTRAYTDWADMLDDACAGRIDVVMNLALTAERTRCLVFTRQYAEAPAALIGRPHDTRLTADPDLKGLRIVTERSFATYRAARGRYPQAKHLEADHTADALRMVASGEADVYLGNPYVASALIAERHITRAVLVRPTDLPLDTLHFAVPNQHAPLAEALDIALASVPEAQGRAIHAHWLKPLNWEGNGLILSDAEKGVLAQPLRLGFGPDWAPISFLDEEGQLSGLAGEYLRRFRAMGANLQDVKVEDWQDVRDRATRGELDAIIGVAENVPWLGDQWVFSQPFLTVANVVVTRQGGESVLDLGDLDGQVIALSNPERLGPLLLAQAPRARIVPARSTQHGLELLREGQVDAYVGNLAVVERFLRERYSGELHVAAPAGIEDRLVLAAHRHYAPLVTAFDRMLLSLSPREREAIRGDWLAVEYRSGLQWRTLLRWAVPLLLILLTGGLVHGLGHWRLRREVQERRRVEKRLDEVTGNLPAVVYQARRDQDGKVNFPFIVGDIPSLFGLSAEQAMHDERDLFARVHPEDRLRLVEAMDRSVAEFCAIDIEFRGLAADGGWHWVRSRGLPHRADDGAVLWSGYWIDVTQAHEQAEELAAAKGAAERAAEAKAEFLATMSHEIRTPMAGLLGMLEMFVHTEADPERRQMLVSVDESAQTLRQILDDVLDFSKIEAGALVLESRPMRLHRLIDSVHRLLAPQAAGKGLHFLARVSDDVAAAHLADGVRLRQILFNLLGNALKFTDHGSVDVAVDLVEDLGAWQKLRISVSDTGIGISPEQQARLFQPFSQAETSTTRRFGGTGLGLSICRRLVDLMAGELSLSSAPGEGTRAEVILTLAVADPASADAAAGLDATTLPQAKQAWQGRRVLVAEDHPINQDLMRLRLHQLGLECEIVGDGRAALEALQRSRFDLLITDCRMPRMDGYALAREIRRREAENGASRRLPIVAMTAEALLEETERCRDAGMDDFLAKPAPLLALRDVIERRLPQNKTPAQILLVATDATERLALTGQLASAGIAFDTVDNQEEADRRLADGGYALVLLDSPPSLETAADVAARGWIRRLRALEQQRRIPRIPVIALLDVAADPSRYLDDGVDGVLRKPLRKNDLLSVIRLWVDEAEPGIVGTEATGSMTDGRDDAGEPGDISTGMPARCRHALLEDLERLAHADSAGDVKVCTYYAHRIKGAALMIGDQELADWAHRIEHGLEAGQPLHNGIAHQQSRLSGMT